jgi:hypothetical protein
MKQLVLFMLGALSVLSATGQQCSWKHEHKTKKYFWLKEPRLHHRLIWIDMGGISAHSEEEIAEGRITKWLPYETHGPKKRRVRDVVYGTMTIICNSNNDTGLDNLNISANGQNLLSLTFGYEWHKTSLLFNLPSPSTITLRVSNRWTLNNSPEHSR